MSPRARTLGALIALGASAAAQTGTPDDRAELERAIALEPAAAVEALEQLYLSLPGEDVRRECLRALREHLPAAAPPLTAAELTRVAALRERSLPLADLLVGRHVVVLPTERFRERAERDGALALFDLEFLALRELFGLDPSARTGGRVLVFPSRDKSGGYTVHGQSLEIAVGRADADRGDPYEPLAHEMAHGFAHGHPAGWLLWHGGFGEGWPEFCMAFVAERLACLGTPFDGRFSALCADFEAAARREYLATRLPIEEIVAYAPSAGLLARLAALQRRRDGTVDWGPFRALIAGAVVSPPPVTPVHAWPARHAREYLRAFEPTATTRILSEYRFPLDAAAQAEIERMLLPVPADGSSAAERWHARGERVLASWRVLGPIPDPDARRLELDPLDAENFVLRDAYTFRGREWRWREDVPVNAEGVVDLTSLLGPRRESGGETGGADGGSGGSVFYLYAEWPDDWPEPATFYAASDDELALWIDGTLAHVHRGNRGTWPDDPDRVHARFARGGGRILAQVANHGGPAGFHLRASSYDPFETGLRPELVSGGEDRKLAAVRSAGSARASPDQVLPLLTLALEDGSPFVRGTAAEFLGGCRNDARVVELLIERWAREKEAGVALALRTSLEELCLTEFDGAAAAKKWWRDERARWRERWYVECEDALRLGTLRGGFYGNNEGAFGSQCIDRGWGRHPDDRFEVVLEAPRAGARVLALRYACPEAEAAVSVRVRRGEKVHFERRAVALPKTADSTDWTWVEIEVPSLPAGRYRVELFGASGGPDCDLLGWRPKR